MRSVLEKVETVSLCTDGAGVTAERQAASGAVDTGGQPWFCHYPPEVMDKTLNLFAHSSFICNMGSQYPTHRVGPSGQ